jgi:hypothetical protein
MRYLALPLAVAVLSACPARPAVAQLITPDSATATSEFSGSYVIGNTINGSGLPANFTLADAHATYAAGNHWTTQSGRTIGESATFTFNVSQTLGVFHMWNHRSNGIANNANYEPVLFDLELFGGPGGTGSSLLLLTNVASQPNVAVAQSFPFVVTAGVRSARFTVRATENGNVSPYTGLAEVRFGPCVEPSVTQAGAPAAAGVCPHDAASFAVVPSGSGPFAAFWQWRLPGQDDWVDVQEGANPPGGGGAVQFTAVGASAQGLTVFPVGVWPVDAGVVFRASVSNPCGQAFSAAAPLLVDAADVGSAGGFPGRDQVHDNNDFIVFISYFFGADARADLGRAGGLFGPDGAFDNNDFIAFISVFFAEC